jgi:hypothetical protein
MVTTRGCVGALTRPAETHKIPELQYVLELIFEDDRASVHAGGREVCPPSAPTADAAVRLVARASKASNTRDVGFHIGSRQLRARTTGDAPRSAAGGSTPVDSPG